LGGEQALSLVSGICPAIIDALPFPKRMRWGSGNITFARPLRWLLALLDAEVVPFSLGALRSGNLTYGHRVHGPGPFTVPHARDYFTVIREQGGIISDSRLRRAHIVEEGNRLAAEKTGAVLWKESLLDEVQGLCERPVPLLGNFSPSYLELPREVLLAAMETHQKSFGLEGQDGNLLPYFLTVLNLRPSRPEGVKKGWERVLRARLEDARFFWRTDLAAGFDTWRNALDSVVFLAPLGSMGDKARRISRLCGWLADSVRFVADTPAVDKEKALRAGLLCKADLVSTMVREFDMLQGIMGAIYALRAGEAEDVAQAIREQYLPAGPDSQVPSTLYGAFLSLADKADTLTGCFGLGMIPTGAADPYGLRRAALGMARIMREKGLRFDLFAFFAQAVEEYGPCEWKLLPEQSLPRLREFLTMRLKHQFLAEGAETLLVEACLLADASDVWAASARLAALTAFSRTEDFSAAVLTFKRAANILRKQTQEDEILLRGPYSPELLVDEAEKALAAELERLSPLFSQLRREDRYAELFALLRVLRPFVDAFFDQVMVMCEDEDKRNNRLSLLQALVSRLGSLADFTALQI
ncbi:MAG: glycine--tRNA ligase subunit beta, partial [Desulfovibrio sp.]|nr:glycine--tRNA ligase subunit beta [Desulfovibrio sp.]